MQYGSAPSVRNNRRISFRSGLNNLRSHGSKVSLTVADEELRLTGLRVATRVQVVGTRSKFLERRNSGVSNIANHRSETASPQTVQL